MTHPEGKWFVVGQESVEITGTRGQSKDEATGKLCEQLQMLTGKRNDWSDWQKRGYKVRKE